MSDPAMAKTESYAREAFDFYETPAWCTKALLSVWTPHARVWEPAAGKGAIVRELEGHDVVASDITDRGAVRGLMVKDFLTSRAHSHLPQTSIITNPPYTDCLAFVERALEWTKPGLGSVAMLMRSEWGHAVSRSRLFSHPFRMKLELTRRPVWFPDRDHKSSPRHNFAWFLWDWAWEGTPEYRRAP